MMKLTVDDRQHSRAVVSTAPRLTRRDFIIATSVVSGGLALSILPRGSMAAQTGTNPEITPWIIIGADDTVTVRVPSPEAGTGNITQIAMYVAEELQCDWSKVRTEPISYVRNEREGNLYLGASGIWSSFAGGGVAPDLMKTMLQTGASARERLRAAAATRWNVPPITIGRHARHWKRCRSNGTTDPAWNGRARSRSTNPRTYAWIRRPKIS